MGPRRSNLQSTLPSIARATTTTPRTTQMTTLKMIWSSIPPSSQSSETFRVR
jgi:hypothetical protein